MNIKDILKEQDLFLALDFQAQKEICAYNNITILSRVVNIESHLIPYEIKTNNLFYYTYNTTGTQIYGKIHTVSYLVICEDGARFWINLP